MLEGADAKSINIKLKALEVEKVGLTPALTLAPEEKPLLHPNLSAIDRARVEALGEVPHDPDHGREVFEVIRSLV